MFWDENVFYLNGTAISCNEYVQLLNDLQSVATFTNEEACYVEDSPSPTYEPTHEPTSEPTYEPTTSTASATTTVATIDTTITQTSTTEGNIISLRYTTISTRSHYFRGFLFIVIVNKYNSENNFEYY